MTTMEKNNILQINDRCDKCGAQAWVLVKGLSGELYFCSHHYNEHKEGLVKWAYEVVDERNFIV